MIKKKFIVTPQVYLNLGYLWRDKDIHIHNGNGYQHHVWDRSRIFTNELSDKFPNERIQDANIQSESNHMFFCIDFNRKQRIDKDVLRFEYYNFSIKGEDLEKAIVTFKYAIPSNYFSEIKDKYHVENNYPTKIILQYKNGDMRKFKFKDKVLVYFEQRNKALKTKKVIHLKWN